MISSWEASKTGPFLYGLLKSLGPILGPKEWRIIVSNSQEYFNHDGDDDDGRTRRRTPRQPPRARTSPRLGPRHRFPAPNAGGHHGLSVSLPPPTNTPHVIQNEDAISLYSLQAEELERFERERRDRLFTETEIKREKDDLHRRIHDHNVAAEINTCWTTSGRSTATISSGRTGRARRRRAAGTRVRRLLGFIARVWLLVDGRPRNERL
ncbi:hypothetical protein Acr_00g0051740 [Actinidia rufa]|uniref:Uncharacterized protein n=1 Tax=Actinidia rufa TaxID=165716 RepID=A0A7J0DKW0_9ERIC|nr:hypothetical protein Acr_00g0051740 [Actinidia rufa]